MTERPSRSAPSRLDQPREVRRAMLPRPTVNQETFGVWSERFARFMGTPRFLIYMTAFVVVWIAWNVLGLVLLANIVITAVLSTPVPFRRFLDQPPHTLPSTFPFVWLPSFLVQVALGSHLLVFRQLRMTQHSVAP